MWLKLINRIFQVEGLYGAALVVNRMTGLSGFFQGLSARVLYQAPSTAVSWSCYEFFKYYLKSREAGAGNEIEGTIADLETAKSSYGKREDVSFEALPQIPELRSPKIPTVMASNTYQKWMWSYRFSRHISGARFSKLIIPSHHTETYKHKISLWHMRKSLNC